MNDAETPAAPSAEPASRVTRLVAHLVDTGLWLACLAMLLVAPALATESAGLRAAILCAGAAGVSAVIYFNLRWLKRDGQSIGKRLFGIRIVNEDGTPTPLGRIVFKRNLLFWIGTRVPKVGPFVLVLDPLLIFRGTRACLHDDVANTHVVVSERPAALPQRS